MCSYTLALVYILYFLRDDGNPRLISTVYVPIEFRCS